MNKANLIELLKYENFSDEIIRAFNKVKRENFVPENIREFAYYNNALPLEKGATISQPSTIAFMLELLELKKGLKILEIGSGCGYVLALLHEITKGNIYGVEIISSLAERSKKTLSRYKNIKIFNKNGFYGLKEKAPFDRILVSASFDKIPNHLYSQMKENGILVCPVRNSIFQIKKIKNKVSIKEFYGFVFVPIKE